MERGRTVDRDIRLSIVIAALRPDEVPLSAWRDLVRLEGVCEVILVCPEEAPGRFADVDHDRTANPDGGIRRDRAPLLVRAPLGRASQLNAGARHARGSHVLFLHGDTIVHEAALRSLIAELHASPNTVFAFSLGFRSRHWRYRVLETGARLRDRWKPAPLGDQGLSVPRALFEEVGGYPDTPLFEDLWILRRLKPHAPLRVLPVTALTSPERFERLGVWRTLARSGWFLVRERTGTSPVALAGAYYGSLYVRRWMRADASRKSGSNKTPRLPTPSAFGLAIAMAGALLSVTPC